ncbi:MAG: heterodisulfide reductase-related iron-sulfur binding cluster [Acidimicrobiales bacterium]|jgi:glycolate dehydrogenase iron-sulfur subunit
MGKKEPSGAAVTWQRGSLDVQPGARNTKLGLDLGLLDACVHCGFCLPTCPTYLLWGEEMDSPRGRIYLMRELVEGERLGTVMQEHFDRCLGCMACMTACPSGVQYDKLIEAARVQVETGTVRPWHDRFLRGSLFALFPFPGRLRVAAVPLRLYQRSRLSNWLHHKGLLERLPAVFQTLEAIAPTVPRYERFPPIVRATGERRGAVGMLTGCVQSVFFSPVNAATVRVLAAEGFDVVIPNGQGCCGALSAHAGRESEAKRFARSLIDTFEQAKVSVIVVNSAGCGSAMKGYAHLLRDDPEYAQRAVRFSEVVRDVSEFLADLEPHAVRHALKLSVAYHDACHLAHAQGVRSQPRDLLGAIPSLELCEVAEGEVCCGSAGTYNLLQPHAATELGDRKARNILDTGAELLVAANPGCMMQVVAAIRRAGKQLPVAHTIEVLDASIRGVPARVLTER